MSSSHGFTDQVLDGIQRAADPAVKSWWERYMRGVIPFVGVNLAEIRTIVQQTAEETGFAGLDLQSILTSIEHLFSENYTESKLAAVICLQDIVSGHIPWRNQIDFLETMLEKRYIFDWNVCDWLCVRVLGPMIEAHGAACAKAVGSWRSDEYLWKARCSAVAFAYLTARGEFAKEYLASCSYLIKRPERFAKTAVGWVLRELAQTDESLVCEFVEKHGSLFSREVLNNALKHQDPEAKKNYLQLIPKVVTATKGDIAPWLSLSGTVEHLFGPMEHSGEFRKTLTRLVSEKRAFCVRDGVDTNMLKGGIMISKNRNRIAWLAVSESHRSAGIGSALLSKGLKQLEQSKPVAVQTFAKQVREGSAARRLYMRFGFREVGEAEENVPGVPTVMMERPGDSNELA